MDDLSDHPFEIMRRGERAAEADDDAMQSWLGFVANVEKALDHDLADDGFSLDVAYAHWKTGGSPETYVAVVRAL